MAEKTVRICDLCLQAPGEIAVSSGALAWRGFRGTVDVCHGHQSALEQLTGAPVTPPPDVQLKEPADSESKSTEPPAPKRRGRPPKAAAAPVSSEAAAPKRRGRPPKAAGSSAKKPTPTAKVTAESKNKMSVLTPSAATIRAWARANDVPVSERGGVGATTLAAYYKAHPDITEKIEIKEKKQPVRGHRVPARKRATKLAGKVVPKKTARTAKKRTTSSKKAPNVPAAQFSGVGG